MISTHSINSLSQYIDFIVNQEHRDISQWLFRGHSDETYELTPSLFRINIKDSFRDWNDVEKYIMTQFKKQAIPYLKYSPSNELEWLAIAQHYGLPTRLLDWTTNALVALFFAVENHYNDKNANVWLYGIPSLNNCLEESTWISRRIDLDSNHEHIIFPNHIDSRITNQSGCFTIHDFPEKNNVFIPLNEQKYNLSDAFTFVKITIDADKKKDILNELYYVGIHQEFIYPDLGGLTAKLKFELNTTHKRNTIIKS
ncbi:hypothetical protein AD998_10800 [bacterium 336/3]|nr:hypothetical protein AD998_10800 [bacterium 336/3]